MELDGEAVLYDATFGTTCRLNETGYFIYKACDGTTSIETIAHRLTETYDVALDIAQGAPHQMRFGAYGLYGLRRPLEVSAN